MKSGILFPLTLTLSLREREQQPTICRYSLSSELSPAPQTISLSPGERAGVRGKAPSNCTVTSEGQTPKASKTSNPLASHGLMFPILAALLFMAAAASIAQPGAASPQTSQEQLLATLTSNAPLAEKWVAVHQLARVSTREAVPRLAALLPDGQLTDLARYALEAIPDPSADRALREALGKLDGRPLAGVITSIGVRRDALAVEPLSKLLSRPDPTVVSATVAALGSIGTVPAAKALEAAFANAKPSIRPAIYSSIIQCADALRIHGSRAEAIRIYIWVRASRPPPQLGAAAIRGLIQAGDGDALRLLAKQLHAENTAILGPLQRDLPGLQVTEVLAAELPKLSAPRQVLLVQALSMRGDSVAIRALTNAARAGEKSVRLAAIREMASNPAFVPVLTELAGDADQALADAAQESLTSLPGPAADAAVLAMLGSNDTRRRLAALEMASRRSLRAAMPTVLQAARAPDAALRTAALNAAADLASESTCRRCSPCCPAPIPLPTSQQPNAH